MRMVKDYMKNDALRHELNELTEKTFGFHFEDWVKNGYFEGDYIPYSLEEDGKMISNVSANRMQFVQNGKIKKYIQIGTVMTDVNYRKKGLARELMEYVIKEYEGSCDGIYLFGDLSALDFYRKLGFEERRQHVYTLKKDAISKISRCISGNNPKECFQAVDKTDEKVKAHYLDSVRKSVPFGVFEQINKFGLQMFYTSDLENVYYSKELDCFIIVGKEGENIELQSVISQKDISFEQILSSMDMEYTNLKLGFTPKKEDTHWFTCEAFDGGEDYRLFCRGSQLESIEQEKLYFPTFSHA